MTRRSAGLLQDEFYFLSDQVLAKFKMFQGLRMVGAPFPPPGFRLEQAHLIWAQCPQNTLRALVRSLFIDDDAGDSEELPKL